MLLFSSKKPVELQITHLNKVQKKQRQEFEQVVTADDCGGCLSKLLSLAKSNAKEKGQDKTTNKQVDAKTIYVLDFDGDIKASAVSQLREEISAIISVAKANDEVVIRLESGGGQVHAYGLAAEQLQRIKEAQLSLTVCVDKIAASGGYMMACVADKIIGVSFSIVGSIGVVSQMPNFYDFLKKHDINIESFTAGEYKRTVTMFDKNDDKDREKYQSELERIHWLFKNHVASHRPRLDIEKVATGEFWFGKDAHTLGLIDELGTSDAYILGLMDNHNVFALNLRTKPNLLEKLGLDEQIGVSITDFVGKAGLRAAEFLAKINRP
ncbi:MULTISPECIES: protease SohB [unclassified Moraxella]|uniref:protease SohB n=1 Tax=unclassified Moraxella TaxID=2685852 RepID=UPI00359EDB60